MEFKKRAEQVKMARNFPRMFGGEYGKIFEIMHLSNEKQYNLVVWVIVPSYMAVFFNKPL